MKTTRMDEHKEVAVIDMRDEAEKLMAEVKESLEFSSSKLYDLKKMADYIKGEYPELSKCILEVVEPLMIKFEKEVPLEFDTLLKKFNK